MDRIIVRFSDLKAVVESMSEYDYDLVEIMINEGDPLEEGETYEDNPDYLPPSLYLSARDSHHTFEWTDYDVAAVLEDID